MEIASLWADIDASAIAPPTVTREQTLPFGSLTWENFERLCFRLAHRCGDVEDARIYGERGQAQEGIDLYVRLATGDYETWQCKRYQEFTPADLEQAITKLLGGAWANRTKRFRLALATSLNSTELSEEIERQRARCAGLNITFEPLDRDRLSVMLKDYPDLVDDFFDRPWVVAFNGAEAAAALSGRKLGRERKIAARRVIHTLYTTHFQTVDGGIPAAAPVFRGAVKPVPVFARYVEPDVELVESVVESRKAPRARSGNMDASTTAAPGAVGFCRREVRTKLALSTAFATGEYFLLVGGAGFGKSAALRVMIHSLLAEEPRFPTMAKAWSQRLPLLLPFAFLTRHFGENETATIESALKAWLQVLGAKNDVLILLQEMLMDERLLLLVDGLDEWQNREAAVSALTALTTYVETRHLPLVATTRPLGLERIGDFGPDWKRANLLPLNANQQLEFATYWFRHFHILESASDAVALEQAVSRDAEDFAYDLSGDSALSELTGVPLLLSVLIYLRLSGRVLPHGRLSALEELVKALLEDQPRRRAQASMQRADQSLARSPRIRRGLEYLAYHIHQEPNSLVLPIDRAAQSLRDYFKVDLELTAGEAEEWANRVLELGQSEFGLLVAPQEGYVGLMHRIFQEYLAAKYLSRLSLERAKAYCVDAGRSRPWHEVTLTLVQLLERQGDVDLLIEELRRPVTDCLDEPGQQILLARLAVANTNCSRSKASEIMSEVFSWIECGRWMALRLALVREVAVGLESEQVGPLVAARAERWFPGRVRWLHDVPNAAARQPTSETVSDLWIALHNCDSGYEYRQIAESLATFAESSPHLADRFIAILKGAAEPDLMAAALHAIAVGWPTHVALPSLLEAASTSPAEELQRVAIIARVKRGERTSQVRDALVGFCREGQHLWPWEEEIIGALATGWPHDPELKRSALERIDGIGHPLSWAWSPAIKYLLQGCPGDNDVARMLAEQLALEDSNHRKLIMSDVHEDLLKGFKRHPLIISAAETWIEKNANAHYSPMDVAVIAQLGDTPKCREALFDWLRTGKFAPAWIISTLQEMVAPKNPDLLAALSTYIQEEGRRADAVRWLPEIVDDPKQLGQMLRVVLRSNDIFNSCSALTMLVEREGRDTSDLWAAVEEKLKCDTGGHYWRLGHRVLLKIWPEHPVIRDLAKLKVYTEEISLSAYYEVYGADKEIRPLLDRTMQVLHEDLRLEFVRALEPLASRGVPSALTISAGFWNEPNGEARTVAAREYARGCVRSGQQVHELATALSHDLKGFFLGREVRQQAAVAALLELGRADLVAGLDEDGKPLRISTISNSHPNWEFVASIVEHWQSLAGAAPDIWARLDHSPVVAAELAKAGKGAYALSQTQVFEDAVRTGKQIEIEDVRALVSLHGRSALLRDLFVARLQHFLPGRPQTMMVMERAAYSAMASYLAHHFHGDVVVGQAMLAVANSPMIHDVGLVALCRGWPDSPPIAAAIPELPKLLEAGEPVAAWLISSKADAALMVRYLLRYPGKLIRDSVWEARDGITAVRARLQSDPECREAVFAELKTVTEPGIQAALVRLLAPSMREETAFRTWISHRVSAGRQGAGRLSELAFDAIGNVCRPLEFLLLEAVLTRS